MWYIVVKEKSNARSKQDFGAQITVWIRQHEANKNAQAYRDNLEGILKDLPKPSRFTQFIEVIPSVGATAIIAKVSITPDSVDLSEIIKHSTADSQALHALFGWAVQTAGAARPVTLTAAYATLVEIYRKYGFELRDADTDSKQSAPKASATAPIPATTVINAPMKMTDEFKAHYRNNWRESVEWELLPDLIG